MIECQHKVNSLCQLASTLAGTDVMFCETTCAVCVSSANPMTENRIVKGLAAATCIRNGDKLTASKIMQETWKSVPVKHGDENTTAVEWTATKKVTGVGTVLSSIFKTVGIVVSDDCSCKRHAVEMDRRGTSWCLENIDTIVEWLRVEASARNLIFFRAGVKVALYGLLRAYSLFENVRKTDTPKAEAFARKDDEWAVVVTAAPRKGEYTLSTCLNSIINAGWTNPIVFAEPGIEVPQGVTAIHNAARRGCFHNWLYSARWALENTTAEMILCVQDDSLFHPDSRQFSEDYCLWPTDDTGFVSLYTAAHYTQNSKTGVVAPVGVNHVHTTCLWGTCAVIWKRSVLQQVVDHPLTNGWLGVSPRKQPDEKHNKELRAQRVAAYYEKRKANPSSINNSDYLAGRLCNELGLKMFFVDPSPVSHISKVSSIGHGGNMGKRNCQRCADHGVSLNEQTGVLTEEHFRKTHMPKIPRTPVPSIPGLPVIIQPGPAVADAPRQTFMIRTSFTDPTLSAYRWGVTQKTLLMSLAAQRHKVFDIQLICGDDDHLQQEKLAAFNKVAPTTLAPADWYNQPHDGVWRRTTRIDDDDIVSVYFTELIAAQPFDGTECLFNFPNGSLMDQNSFYRWEYPENQFLTIQSNTRLTPYHFPHQHFRHTMPTVIVSEEIHWLWVRHHGVLSGATPGAVPKKFKHGIIDVDTNRFPYDMAEVRESLLIDKETAAKVLNLRNEYGRHDIGVKNICSGTSCDDLTALAALYGTDKGSIGTGINHQYTLIYDRIMRDQRDKVEHVLEFGVLEGASLRMWSDYFPNAMIHGLDIKKRIVDHARVVTHKFNSVTPLTTHYKFDLVIDDASHLSNHQRIMFGLHSKHVKPGGYYVIEDLHACRMGRSYLNESPSMLETCRKWVSEPPFGWTCELYGDQLCVLRKSET